MKQVFILNGYSEFSDWVQSIHKTREGAEREKFIQEQKEIESEPNFKWRNWFTIEERELKD